MTVVKKIHSNIPTATEYLSKWRPWGYLNLTMFPETPDALTIQKNIIFKKNTHFILADLEIHRKFKYGFPYPPLPYQHCL